MSKTADILRVVAAAINQVAEVIQADDSPKSVPEILSQVPKAESPPSCDPKSDKVPTESLPTKPRARKPAEKPAPEEAPVVDREEIRQRLVLFIRTNSRGAAASLLKGVGFNKLSDVPDDRLHDVLKALEAQNG